MYRKHQLPIKRKIKSWADLYVLERMHKCRSYAPVDKNVYDMELAAESYKHTKYMSKQWHQFTYDSIVHSCFRIKYKDNRGKQVKKVIYEKNRQIYDRNIKEPKVILLQTGLLDAALEVDEGRNLCIISPTYHNSICSGFFYGHVNPETELCKESNLYNIASCAAFYKKWENNRLRKKQRKGKYIHSLFYMHKVLFERDDILKRYDVIMCWPPKCSANHRNAITHNEIEELIEDRLSYAFSAAEERGVSTVVLNDWGCDDFLLNNPYTVARAAKKAMQDKQIERVVFAIRNKEHYRIFRYVFDNK